VDAIYRLLPVTEMERGGGMVRVIDNEGEDYLYPMRWFEAVPEENLTVDLSELLTVRLNGVTKLTVRDIARRQGVSMASLVREWIEERLDLPTAA
jgi:predicted DNA-binding protein (UPF0251 family)